MILGSAVVPIGEGSTVLSLGERWPDNQFWRYVMLRIGIAPTVITIRLCSLFIMLSPLICVDLRIGHSTEIRPTACGRVATLVAIRKKAAGNEAVAESISARLDSLNRFYQNPFTAPVPTAQTLNSILAIF